MRTYFCLLTALIIAAGVTGCKCPKKVTQQEQATKRLSEVKQEQPQERRTTRDTDADEVKFSETSRMGSSFALPNVIIYKTKSDYIRNVPVGLNEERTAIISYPGKTDLRGRDPERLEFGFLLDRRGINTNVAFLKYTYDEYLQLSEIPPITELFNLIIDADPLIEMYNCGKASEFRQGEVAEQLNDMLRKNEGKPENVFKKMK